MIKTNSDGLTLTELLVATVIIGVVMIGVAAFSLGIKQMQTSTGLVTILETQLMTAMADIEKNATLAIGYADNPGMVANAAAPPEYFSFRKDTNTPADFSDDVWIIYFIQHPVVSSEEVFLYKCEAPATAANPDPASNPTVSGCDATNSLLLLQNVTYSDIEFSLVQNSDPNNLAFYFEISLKTRSEPEKSFDPIKNPEAVLSSRFSSSLHTW